MPTNRLVTCLVILAAAMATAWQELHPTTAVVRRDPQFSQSRTTARVGDAVLMTRDIEEPERSLRLQWKPTILPGNDVLSVRETLHQQTVSHRFTFAGVLGDSMQLTRSSSTQDRAGKPGESDMTLYVERSSDGAFHFAPGQLEHVGRFRIQRNPQDPATYAVTFNARL